jgi:spore coat polysaccharide biosynthesis protein SpsF
MNVVVIVQARIGSTRLPGKVLKKIKDKTILDYVIDRLKFCKNIDDIILATTTDKKDDVLEEYAIKKKINYFRGSEEDVLARYYFAAKKFGADVIVRITSDCPFIDPEIVDSIIIRHLNEDADYTANILKRTYPRGVDTEVINFDALKKSYENADQKFQREHVTPYIARQPNKFKLISIEAEGNMRRPDIRITIDTKEDFELIEKILLHFDNLNFKTADIIDFLDENPELLEINKNVKHKD